MPEVRRRDNRAAAPKRRDLNKFLLRALSLAHEAIIAADSRHRVTFWNKGAEDLYGIKADEALRHTLKEVFQCRWPGVRHKPAARDSLASAGRWRGESIHVKKNGEKLNVEWTLSPLKGARGTPPGLLAVIRDVTKHKRARERLRQERDELGKRVQAGAAEVERATGALQAELAERRRAEEALRESESILRSFYESSPFMMGIVELLEDDILHISDNTATAKFFGRTPEAMRNRRGARGPPPLLVRC